MIDIKDKNVVIYGGSFDPIHIGHLLTAYDIIEKTSYDYVLFVPVNVPVHKDFDGSAPAQDRIKMVELSIERKECFGLSDIEIARGGLSYTIDTVEDLTEKFQYKKKFGVVFGDDLLDGLSDWKSVDRLQNITELLCLSRENKQLDNFKYKVTCIKNRIVEISSSEIRRRIKNSMDINYMVTDKVADYILKKGLYR